MFPRVQLKLNDRVIIDSEGVSSEVEGSTLTFKLKDSDTIPMALDSELVTVGGWKLNVISLIDSKASSQMVVSGWHSFGKLVPMNRLLIPFLYSTSLDFIRFRFSGIEPHWTRLLRLCYWFEKCLEMNDGNFHYKQMEIKRAIMKPLKNVESTLNDKGRRFIQAMEQLNKTIASYTSELKFPALVKMYGHRTSFDKNHDSILDGFPSEVKSIYSHATIEEETTGIPKLNIRGQVIGENVNPYDEFFKFVFSRKVIGHVSKAYNQGGKIIFVDVTHTFASFLLYMLSTQKGTNLSFDKALSNAMTLITSAKEKRLPVIFVSSLSSYEQLVLALLVPIPLKVLSKTL